MVGDVRRPPHRPRRRPLVLLVACERRASCHGRARQREMAVRAAVSASRAPGGNSSPKRSFRLGATLSARAVGIDLFEAVESLHPPSQRTALRQARPRRDRSPMRAPRVRIASSVARIRP
jgi:hypothetical protein